jgi:hypothetical protein
LENREGIILKVKLQALYKEGEGPLPNPTDEERNGHLHNIHIIFYAGNCGIDFKIRKWKFYTSIQEKSFDDLLFYPL